MEVVLHYAEAVGVGKREATENRPQNSEARLFAGWDGVDVGDRNGLASAAAVDAEPSVVETLTQAYQPRPFGSHGMDQKQVKSNLGNCLQKGGLKLSF